MSEKKFLEPKASNIRKSDGGETLVDIQMVEVEKKVQEVRDGMSFSITAVIPQGEEEGFFLVREEGSHDGPLVVKTVDLGRIQLVARVRTHAPSKLAVLMLRCIKTLLDGKSDLVKVGKLPWDKNEKYIFCKDLAKAFNGGLALDDMAVKKMGVTARTVGEICKYGLGLSSVRFAEGLAVILADKDLFAISQRIGDANLTFAPSDNLVDGDLK